MEGGKLVTLEKNPRPSKARTNDKLSPLVAPGRNYRGHIDGGASTLSTAQSLILFVQKMLTVIETVPCSFILY